MWLVLIWDKIYALETSSFKRKTSLCIPLCNDRIMSLKILYCLFLVRSRFWYLSKNGISLSVRSFILSITIKYRCLRPGFLIILPAPIILATNSSALLLDCVMLNTGSNLTPYLRSFCIFMLTEKPASASIRPITYPMSNCFAPLCLAINWNSKLISFILSAGVLR